MNEPVNNLFGFFDQKKCQAKKGKAVKKTMRLIGCKKTQCALGVRYLLSRL